MSDATAGTTMDTGEDIQPLETLLHATKDIERGKRVERIATGTNDEIGRRLGMAYVMTTRYAEALPVLDGLLSRHPTEPGLLLAAIVSQYELVQGGQVASVADVARMRRYVGAYKGSESALARKYLEAIQAK